MKDKDRFKIAYFIGNRQEIFVTEFGYSMRHSGIKVGPSTREFYVLHFELCGNSQLGELDIERGDAFILSKNKVHSFRATERSERYWICFGGSRADEILSCFGVPTDSNACFKVSNSKLLERDFSQLFKLACEHENSEEGEIYALSALMSILPRLSNIKKTSNSPIDDYVSRAEKYIKQNCQRNLKMRDVAARLCISEKHLYRLFVEKRGLSPKAMFQKLRMEKSERLLIETKMTISEIALATGFSSSARFYQAFVKFYGISPTKFRAQSLQITDA